MIRIILFLLLIALAAAGAAWLADQPGDLVLNWGGLRLTSRQPMYLLGLVIVVAMVAGGMFAQNQQMQSRFATIESDLNDAREEIVRLSDELAHGMQVRGVRH